METRIFDDSQELALESAALLREQLHKKPDLLISFAAGRTQLRTYEIVANWSRGRRLDLKNARVVGLDEIVGAKTERAEGFRYFLDTHLFRPAGFMQEKIEFFNPCADDMARECARMDGWLDENGPIDFLLLGVGVNGHIGYNEPGSSSQARTHVVKQLERESMKASATYFDHSFDLSSGITLGLKDLLSARVILLQITGAQKAAVAAALQRGDVTPAEMPVMHLLERDNVYLFMDKAAAG